MDMYPNNNIYNPYQQNSLYPFAQPFRADALPRTEIVKVNGKNGADAYQMAPNSSALLLDQKDPLIWFVSTDGAGYKTCIPYTITPYKQQEPEDLIAQLNARISKLEERMNGKNEPNNVVAQSTEQREWNL